LSLSAHFSPVYRLERAIRPTGELAREDLERLSL